MAPILAAGDFAREIEALRAHADALAARLGGAATALRTLGRERAILRLLGVGGIDREGRPLAAEVVDRYVGGRRDRLASGIALPFAMALHEYDVSPQQLALDVAAGTIDLEMEAELLAAPARRAEAESVLTRLLDAAVERIDANRTARRELLGVLGEREPPWIGTTLLELATVDAIGEAAELVRAGADLIRVEVPVRRELAMHLGEPEREELAALLAANGEPDPSPTGSQRGLTRLRQALDAAAAERGAYVRLSTAPAPLAGPEGAIVAAFERSDILELDPMAEIIETGVDPERALADFAFAALVVRRADTTVMLGAGPPVVAPDLDAGGAADPATRCGRSLAVQLLMVALAARHGLAGDAVIIGAVPGWLIDEHGAPARAAAAVAMRRALMPGHPLAFVEPRGHEAGGRWAAIMAAVMPGHETAVVLRRPSAGAAHGPWFATVAANTRAAGEVARELDTALGPRIVDGLAREHTAGSIASAAQTLERLDRQGWEALTGATPERKGHGRNRLGGDSVAPAADRSDPVERALEMPPPG
jgi:hypothetical protein